MLLGDSDIDEPAGEALAEWEQARGVGHGGGQRNELGATGALDEHRVGKGGGKRAVLQFRQIVQVLDRVILGRAVAPSLLGHDVDHDRALGRRGVRQRSLQAR